MTLVFSGVKCGWMGLGGFRVFFWFWLIIKWFFFFGDLG